MNPPHSDRTNTLEAMLRSRLKRLAVHEADPVTRAVYQELGRRAEHEFTIPGLPGLATQLRQIDPMSKASGRRIAALISRDPGVVARVVRVANSARYSRQPTNDLTQAVTRVGLRTVKQIAVGTVVQNAVCSGPNYRREMANMRKSGFRVAVASSMLARSVNRELDGPSFMAGLFHDIGRALVLRNAPPEADLPGPVTPALQSMDDLVLTAMTTHFLQRAKMPADIRSAAAFCRRPTQCPPEYAALTWLVWSVLTRNESQAPPEDLDWPLPAPPLAAVDAALASLGSLG